MARQPDQEDPARDNREQARFGWFSSRSSSSTESLSPPPAYTSPSQDDATQQDPRLDTSRKPPENLPKLGGKFDPSSFQTNFPQQQGNNVEGASIGDAFKTIKPEDFLSVQKTPCARNGYIAGIVAGGLMGGIRFMMRAPIPKVANWAVGSAIAGAATSYEWCQYQRRMERVKMRRAVEIYQDNTKEKRRQEALARVQEKEEAAKREAELAKQKSWYQFW